MGWLDEMAKEINQRLASQRYRIDCFGKELTELTLGLTVSSLGHAAGSLALLG